MPRLMSRVRVPFPALNPHRVDFFLIKIGAVPKWLKGKVCKTFIHRFESDRRLKSYLNFQMYYVYILLSIKDNRRYFGFTNNIERRLFEHNNGLVKSTRNRRPLRIIHTETFTTKEEAMKREKELKKKKGKDSFRIL